MMTTGIINYIGALRCDCGATIRVEDDWSHGGRRFYHGQGEAILTVTNAELADSPARFDEAAYLHWVTPWLARIHEYERIDARPVLHDAVAERRA